MEKLDSFSLFVILLFQAVFLFGMLIEMIIINESNLIFLVFLIICFSMLITYLQIRITLTKERGNNNA